MESQTPARPTATRLPSFVLGYHGCDETLAEDVLSGKKHLPPAENSYDWLGHGIYFWEYSARRAFDWAKTKKKSRPPGDPHPIMTPAVVGAVIDLGICLNLLEQHALDLVGESYKHFKKRCALTGYPLPENIVGKDKVMRNLDCAVIQHLHESMQQSLQHPSFESVRGMFREGKPLYPEAGFYENNHIQICVRNTDCIIGYFRVRKIELR